MNPPAPLFLLRFAAIPANLKMVRCVVEAASCQAGCAEAVCNHVVIAVNEACMNIIQHGYRADPAGEIELEFRNNDGVLEFILHDQAPTVAIEEIRPRDLDDLRPGGLGTHFIREIMDEFSHVPGTDGKGNQWRLTKTITHSE